MDEAPKSDSTAWARYYIGLSLQRQGEYNAAITEYDTLVSRYRAAPPWPRRGWAEARCMRLLGNESGAAAEYLSTARANPGTSQGQRGLWEAGIGLYRLGNATGAISTWEELLAAYPKDENRSRTLFWSGKAMLAQGEDSGGTEAPERSGGENPPDHYALRAADLLGIRSTARAPGHRTARPARRRRPVRRQPCRPTSERGGVGGRLGGRSAGQGGRAGASAGRAALCAGPRAVGHAPGGRRERGIPPGAGSPGDGRLGAPGDGLSAAVEGAEPLRGFRRL